MENLCFLKEMWLLITRKMEISSKTPGKRAAELSPEAIRPQLSPEAMCQHRLARLEPRTKETTDNNHPPQEEVASMEEAEKPAEEDDKDEDKEKDKDKDGNHKGTKDDPLDVDHLEGASAARPVTLNDDDSEDEDSRLDDDDTVDADHLEGTSAALPVLLTDDSEDYDGHDTTQRFFLVPSPRNRRGPELFPMVDHEAMVNGKKVTAYLYKNPGDDPLYDP